MNFQAFFRPSRSEQFTAATDYFSGRTASPRLCIGLTPALTAKKIAALKIYVNQILVSRSCHKPSGHTFHRGRDVVCFSAVVIFQPANNL